jgi:nucleoside-diphosphate-sugar epimerase
MNVFVAGANGYVGFSVARAFRQAGHDVWGLTRSLDKARELVQNEIHPVLGDLRKPDEYQAVARKSDVLIHAARLRGDDAVSVHILTLRTIIEAAQAGSITPCGQAGQEVSDLKSIMEGVHTDSNPRMVIFTSGTWVYGDTHGAVVDESAPLAPARKVAWRPEVERIVLQAPGIRGIVLRPGIVYGHGRGSTEAWFSGAHNKNLRIVGEGHNHWALVHVDDLAQAYLLAAESALAGEVLNVTDGSLLTVGEMADAVVQAAGYRGVIHKVPVAEAATFLGDEAEALAMDQMIDSGKAMRLLGWQPRHADFITDVEIQYAAWKARHE